MAESLSHLDQQRVRRADEADRRRVPARDLAASGRDHPEAVDAVRLPLDRGGAAGSAAAVAPTPEAHGRRSEHPLRGVDGAGAELQRRAARSPHGAAVRHGHPEGARRCSPLGTARTERRHRRRPAVSGPCPCRRRPPAPTLERRSPADLPPPRRAAPAVRRLPPRRDDRDAPRRTARAPLVRPRPAQPQAVDRPDADRAPLPGAAVHAQDRQRHPRDRPRRRNDRGPRASSRRFSRPSGHSSASNGRGRARLHDRGRRSRSSRPCSAGCSRSRRNTRAYQSSACTTSGTPTRRSRSSTASTRRSSRSGSATQHHGHPRHLLARDPDPPGERRRDDRLGHHLPARPDRPARCDGDGSPNSSRGFPDHTTRSAASRLPEVERVMEAQG